MKFVQTMSESPDCFSQQGTMPDSSLDDMALLDEPLAGDDGDQLDPAPNKFLHCHHCNKQYRQPRILQCLHVFCTGCLEQLAMENDDGGKMSLMSREERVVITCPICHQDTQTWAIEKLPIDLIMMNMIDVADIREKRMICTSCKAQEKAVARCCDCASFLCPNCVTAHKFMRCFEQHKVDAFEDLLMAEQIDIHKPFFCSLHPVESVKYFCNTCQVPVCSECMLSSHKAPNHTCEKISTIEVQQVDELRNIVTETRAKIASCDAVSTDLENMLSDLQQQRDYAQDLIKETCQSYKAILEKCQEEFLKELEDIHAANELAIMDMANNTEKTSDRINDGCRFTERILEQGNGVEILSLKKFISHQLLTLLNNVPRLEPPVKIEFETDFDKFSAAVKSTFGHFKKAEPKKMISAGLHDASLQSSFEGEQFASGGLSPFMAAVSDYLPNLASLGNVSPDLVTSMAAAGIAGLSLHGSGVGHLTGHGSLSSSGHVTLPTSSMHGGMPSFPERSLSRNSYSPAMSDSGISMDAASTGSLANLGVNLNALSKQLGPPFAVNAQGQITLNGQAIPGLNFNSAMAAGAPGLVSRTMSMPPVSDSGSLAGLLSSVSSLTSPTTPLSATSPPLGDLSSLLNTLPPSTHQLLGVGGSAAGVGSLRDDSPGATAAAVSLLTGQTHSSLNGVGSQSILAFGDGQGPLRTRSGGSKSNAMQIRCKFGQLGPGKGQFNSPHGFCLGVDEDIVVADTNNHRIQIFDKIGEFKSQFGVSGRDEGQLWYPRKVAVIRTSGKYVVCDRGSERSRMQLFTKTGQFIKKIGIRYIDIVAGLAISAQGNIVAVDSVSPTVFCINDNGDLVRWFDCSDHMREPSDIAVSGKEYYVCDFKGHCVVVFNEEGQFMHRIGCENITNYPNGIDISDAGDILVGDSHGNRFHIAVFQRDGSLIGEFECPYVKVSRCCGLKITQEGYVVTLAKNNQHVLVLNTLYIA